MPNILSKKNNTTTPLGANGGGSDTFTGGAELAEGTHIGVDCITDKESHLFFEFSKDNDNWDSSFPPNGYRLQAGRPFFRIAERLNRYTRVRIVNQDSSAQTYLRLSTYFGDYKQGIAPFNLAIAEDADATVIRTDSEEEVMKGRVAGQYIIPKYARNNDVDAAEDIWDGGGDYTGFPTTSAEEFQVASSDPADTLLGTGARTIRIFYYNDDYEFVDANGNFLYVDVNLNGTTYVDSGVTGMRVWRAKVINSGDGQTNAGDITIRWKTTTSVIFTKIFAGYAQTEVSAFTIPAGFTGYLKHYAVDMLDNTSNAAEMAIKVRDFGSNTWRLVRPFKVSTTIEAERHLYGGEKFEEKTDFIFRAISVTNANAIITADYGVLLVKNP